MQRFFPGALCAAVLAGISGNAAAVPVHFEFSGVVTQASATTPNGTAVTGGFDLETDRLLSTGSVGGVQYSFLDWQPTDLAQPLAYLDFDGTHHEIPSLDQNYAMVSFVDGCQPLCNIGWAEDINLGAFTQDVLAPGFTGQLHSSSITLFNVYENLLPDFPYFQGYDAFDGATAVPLDILTMPLAHLDGTYFESVSDCVDGSCPTSQDNYFVFDITSLSRSVRAVTSVPEPGTLGLLAAGLGLLLFRRRQLLQR